ncbi:DUF4429 domain-containing protein [Nocardiopsis trehalosi]|jgi:hypothetical protein|uniref:DUF4429 domain-containing protein n=1 Tax=Nocardiopsis trehalosi TaxID=109329 RepID=UPI00083225B9|nr:DUF4429 domain-containing protein [Nocardiopsis trehalosi]
MDELRGDQGVWRFTGDAVVLTYARKVLTPALFTALGRAEVPLAAVASADLTPGRKRWELRLRLKDRTDPYTSVGADLAPRLHPFRLTGPARDELVAEYHAEQITTAAALAGDPPADAATRLVARLPLHVRTGEGTASFDGTTVRLEWSGTASAVKKSERRREYALADIAGVAWVPSSDSGQAHIRLTPHREDDGPQPRPKHDLRCLRGSEAGAERARLLLLAATVTAHLWADGGPHPALPPAPDPADAPADPPGGAVPDVDWVYRQIERLARLHADGILTDAEFTEKKADLLGRI